MYKYRRNTARLSTLARLHSRLSNENGNKEMQKKKKKKLAKGLVNYTTNLFKY